MLASDFLFFHFLTNKHDNFYLLQMIFCYFIKKYIEIPNTKYKQKYRKIWWDPKIHWPLKSIIGLGTFLVRHSHLKAPIGPVGVYDGRSGWWAAGWSSTPTPNTSPSRGFCHLKLLKFCCKFIFQFFNQKFYTFCSLFVNPGNDVVTIHVKNGMLYKTNITNEFPTSENPWLKKDQQNMPASFPSW